MCGIFGMVALERERLSRSELLPEMGRSIRHRGPDGPGLREGSSFGLGCERLRIVDLHERADQPFDDPRTGTTLTCNGEIYNAAELRRRYGDYPYRSASDVETILPLYADRGTAGIAELDGMFGLAIWDEAKRALMLARDRAGEKPLFYTRSGGEIWFASELQALLLNPAVIRELDREAIVQYLTLGYVLEPRTMFRDIRRIEAGTIATFNASGTSVCRYWDPVAIATSSPTPEDGSRGVSDVRRLRALMGAAVRKQVWAEVPVGVFISGGLDSTLLTTLAARKVGVGGIHTFAARFDEGSYDESGDAAVYARRLGTVHHEVPINEDSMSEALSAVTEGLAEPIADPAILPTYLLAREARKHVKVILSGEGADELFGGYPTYLGHKLAPLLGGLPAPLRALVRGGVERLPASRRKVTLEFLLKRFVRGAELPWIDRHLAWFGTGIENTLLPQGGEATSLLPEGLGFSSLKDSSNAPLLDYCTYLRDNLLVKVDRATMLNSVEARAPFLDRDLSAFALALPANLKIRRLTTKWLLKKAAIEWLPRATVYRKKRGLSVPVASWIDRGLRSEVDRLLEPERLRRQELFDPERVGRLLSEHRAGKANHARSLWALIVFQYWLERWVPERAG